MLVVALIKVGTMSNVEKIKQIAIKILESENQPEELNKSISQLSNIEDRLLLKSIVDKSSELLKSGYSTRSGADDPDNIKRKSKNIGGGLTTGLQSMPHQKEWGGTGVDSASREAQQSRRKSAKNHVHVKHPETGKVVDVVHASGRKKGKSIFTDDDHKTKTLASLNESKVEKSLGSLLQKLRKAQKVVSLAGRKKAKKKQEQLKETKDHREQMKDIGSQIDAAMAAGMDEHGNLPEQKKPDLKLVKNKYTRSLAQAKQLTDRRSQSKLDYSPQSKTSVGTENMRPGKAANIHTTREASSIGSQDRLTPGTRITYRDKSPKTGKQLYSDPDTFKSEVIKYDSNGQWSLDKAKVDDVKYDGKKGAASAKRADRAARKEGYVPHKRGQGDVKGYYDKESGEFVREASYKKPQGISSFKDSHPTQQQEPTKTQTQTMDLKAASEDSVDKAAETPNTVEGRENTLTEHRSVSETPNVKSGVDSTIKL